MRRTVNERDTPHMSFAVPLLRALLVVAFLAGCSQSTDTKDAKKSGPPPTLITVAKAESRPVEVAEETVGTIENVYDPRVSAEVAGRVVAVHGFVGKRVKRGDILAEIDSVDLETQGRADASEVGRLEALLANQARVVANQQKLVERNFISQNALDESIAQQKALAEQLAGARARLDSNRNALRKTRVVAPIDGEVETRIVAPGDYVKVGDPLFQLVGTQRLRAHLPFAESAAPRLRPGQKVRLSSPLVPGTVIEATVSEIRPTVTATSRALDVIVNFESDGRFRGGGTVNAEVVTAVRDNAVVVPEQSVVLRPAGKVVYVIAEGRAMQRLVETGYKKDGMLEIVKGLAPGEIVAVDGAGFLTNNAPVATPQRGGAGKAGPGGAGKGSPAEGTPDKAGAIDGAVRAAAKG